MAVAAGTLDARLAPGVAARSEALRRRAEGDPAAPREILAVAAWAAAFANEPADGRGGARAPGPRASPRPTPDPGDLPSTWFSLATIVLVWAERYAEAAELLETAVVECRAAGRGRQPRDRADLSRVARAAAGRPARRPRSTRRTGVEAADLPLPLLYRLIATGILVGALVERGEPEAAARALAPVERLGRGARHGPRDAPAGPRAPAHGAGAHARTRSPTSSPSATWPPGAACARRASSRGARRPPWPTSCSATGRPRSRWPRTTWRWRARFDTPRALGVALRATGLAAGGRRGEALLREAVAVLAGADARVEHIRAQTDLGAHLRRANRRAEAREHLRAALDAAHHAGAGALAARAETELRATGARPRRVVLSGLDSLTASERRVAELARDGMTNREIAQSLFVTARTVEGHLTQVFRKLDLSARDELAGALAPAGA